MRLPIQIEGIIFRKNKSRYEYLILKRIPSRGGFWQPLSGGVEEGETPLKALKREFQEETQIKKCIRIIKNVHYFEFLDKDVLKKEYVFGVEVAPQASPILDPKEHSEYKWCSYTKALKLLKWPNNKIALSKLRQILR